MLRIFIFVSMGQISCNFQWSKSEREKALGVEERRYVAFQTQIMTPWKVNMRFFYYGLLFTDAHCCLSKSFFQIIKYKSLIFDILFSAIYRYKISEFPGYLCRQKKSHLKPLTVQTITWTLFTFANTTDADWLNQPLIIFTTKILFDEESFHNKGRWTNHQPVTFHKQNHKIFGKINTNKFVTDYTSHEGLLHEEITWKILSSSPFVINLSNKIESGEY